MAVDKFQLTVEASTRGEQDLARMEAAINRFNTTAEKSSTKTKALGTDMSGAGDKIKSAFADPMGAATEAAEGLLAKLGPMGIAVGVVATGAIAAGTAVLGLAKSFGDMYEQQSNNALRLGVSIREYSQFAQVSAEAGLSQDVLVGSMRGLSKALDENSEEGKKAKVALRQMGIESKDASGQLRPMRDLLFDIADGLGSLPNIEKQSTAIKILGRSALEVLPLMNSELRTQVMELEAAGFGWTGYGEQVGKAMDATFDRWNRMKKQMGWGLQELAAGMVMETMDPGMRVQSMLARQKGSGSLQLVDPSQPGGLPPGLVDPRSLDERLAESRRKQIRAITGAGLQGRLGQVRTDLSKAIEDTDVAAVRRLTAEYKSLEAAIKAAAEAEKAGTFVARGMKDPYRLSASLYRDGERPLWGGTLGTFGATGTPSLLRSGESANGGRMGIDPATLQRSTDAARATTEYQARKLELMTGPGGEIAAIQAATALRLQALEQERGLAQDTFDIERQRLQITRDGELQILEIQKARAAETRAAGASIFDAITAGGGGIKNYAAGLGMGTGRTIFSNVYSQIAGGMSGKLSLTSNPNSMLGKILQGTPFGADPNAQAGAVQMTAAQIQMQAAQTQLSAAGMGGTTGGVGSLLGLMGGGSTSSLPASVAMLNPFYKGGGMSTGMRATMGIGAGIGAGLGVMSGIQQGGAAGALTTTASLAGGAAALLPMLGPALAMAGPIGGAIAIGATLAMAFLPDPKQARQRALEEQAKQRVYDEASGVEYNADVYGRNSDYGKRGDVRVYLNVNALDSQSIIDRQADIGEAVRQALSSYPPLAMDMKGAALGA